MLDDNVVPVSAFAKLAYKGSIAAASRPSYMCDISAPWVYTRVAGLSYGKG
jgi:hypothetical protein